MVYPDKIEDKIGFTAIREELVSRCLGDVARSLCERMRFSTERRDVIKKLRSVNEMVLALSAEDPFPLDRLPDAHLAVKALQVDGSWLSAKDFVMLRQTMMSMEAVEKFFRKSNAFEAEEIKTAPEDVQAGYSGPYPVLMSVAENLGSFPGIVKMIDTVIDHHGEVRDNATPQLADIRRSLASMSGVIASAMKRVIRKAVEEGYLEADVTPSVRDGRQVIPVAPMNKRKIPGIVHDESASGKTFFIEPAEVVEANNRLRELQLEEKHEIVRILVALSDKVRPYCEEIGSSLEILGMLDFIRAKALYAVDYGCNLPDISRHIEMDWYGAFHPVLRNALSRQGKQLVKLSVTLTPKKRILVVSGPNAGGKSVVLKTVAIVQYMAQCGMLPPLDSNSHLGVFKTMMLDIGDDQSMEDDLSTYSSHLRNMKQFLRRAGSETLVLMDEFGSGTEPRIGGAIAEAILRKLADKGTWGVVTTHFQNIKELADSMPMMINGSMLYDRQLMKPLFTLSIGTPGSSFAIEIARQTGLPEDVLKDVEEIVGKGYLDLDRYLMDINRDKRYWENKRNEIRNKERRLESMIEKLEAEALELKSRKSEMLKEARAQAQSIIEGSNAAIERTILEIRKTQAEKEATRQARQKLREEQHDLLSDSEDISSSDTLGKTLSNVSEVRRRSGLKKRKSQSADTQSKPVSADKIEVGSVVTLDGHGSPGKVLEIDRNNAVVAFGNLKTTVKLDRLKPSAKSISSGTPVAATFISRSTADDSRNRQLNFSPEIDVRGMRAAEAVQAVTYFIDDAVQFNADRVRILHGTGTGALRQYIREYLNTVSSVTNFHDEDVRFGGAGITVVEF